MVYEVCFRILCLFHLELRTWSHKVNSGIKTNTRTLPRPAFVFYHKISALSYRQSTIGLAHLFLSLSLFHCLPVSPLSFRFAFAVRFAARSPAKWLRWADASHVLCQRRQRRDRRGRARSRQQQQRWQRRPRKSATFSPRRDATQHTLSWPRSGGNCWKSLREIVGQCRQGVRGLYNKLLQVWGVVDIDIL